MAVIIIATHTGARKITIAPNSTMI